MLLNIFFSHFIDSHKKQLEDKLHIDISSIGIGDKVSTVYFFY